MGTGLGLNVSHTTSHVIKWDRTTTTTQQTWRKREKKKWRNAFVSGVLCFPFCAVEFLFTRVRLVSEILLGHASDAIQFSISTFTTSNAPTFLTYSIYNRRVLYMYLACFGDGSSLSIPSRISSKVRTFFLLTFGWQSRAYKLPLYKYTRKRVAYTVRRSSGTYPAWWIITNSFSVCVWTYRESSTPYITL